MLLIHVVLGVHVLESLLLHFLQHGLVEEKAFEDVYASKAFSSTSSSMDLCLLWMCRTTNSELRKSFVQSLHPNFSSPIFSTCDSTNSSRIFSTRSLPRSFSDGSPWSSLRR